MPNWMSREEILDRLRSVKRDLEVFDGRVNLSGYADGAIDLAYEAVCHAIDVVSIGISVDEQAQLVADAGKWREFMESLSRPDKMRTDMGSQWDSRNVSQ